MSSLKLKHSGGNSVSLNPPSSAPTSSDVAFKLPNADGSAGQVLQTDGSGNLSWVTPGLTHARAYRVPSNFTLSSSEMTVTDWEYADTNSSGIIGSGWSLPSSGVFSFPATGIYLVKANAMIKCASGVNQPYMGVELVGTIDNSSYVTLSQAWSSQSDDFSLTRYHNTHSAAYIDCTDTSQVKFKINVYRDNNYGNIEFVGNSNQNTTWVEVTRLGDT